MNLAIQSLVLASYDGCSPRALVNDESAGMYQTVRGNPCPCGLCSVYATKPIWTSLEFNSDLRFAKAVGYNQIYGVPRRVVLR
jgi:hypothetical protein